MKTNLILICLALLFFVGCGQSHPTTHHTYTVTLYSSTGTVIQTWTGVNRVYVSSGGVCSLYNKQDEYYAFMMVSGVITCERVVQN